jgi:hypothetical protein
MGMTTLAGKAVGAAFVGCSAAAIAISELPRFLHGDGLNKSIDLDLRAADHLSASPNTVDMTGFNPGFVFARQPVWRKRSNWILCSHSLQLREAFTSNKKNDWASTALPPEPVCAVPVHAA